PSYSLVSLRRLNPSAQPSLAERRLAPFVGLDLRTLQDDGKVELKRILTAILPEKYRPEGMLTFDPLSTWMCQSIWRYQTASGENRFLLFAVCPDRFPTSQSFARVHIFDASCELLNTAEFPTGWGTEVVSAVLRKDQTLNDYCIDVKSVPVSR